MGASKPRVMFVEDEGWQAETFDRQFKRIHGIDYLGVVNEHAAILPAVRDRKPDILFLDLHIDGAPDPSMVVVEDIIPALRREFPKMIVVAITNLPHLLGPAHDAGAHRVYRKMDMSQVESIKRLLKELFHISLDEPDALTGREREVLQLLDAGLSNTEMSAELNITVHAVKSHLQHIYEKLGVSNRTAAIRAARDRGYV